MSLSSQGHKAKAAKTLSFGIYICSTSRYRLLEKGEADSQRLRRRLNG